MSDHIVRARDDLTLFCDIYNGFLMFFIDFFVLSSNPTSASLKSLSIFVDSRSKVNLKVKYDFSRNEARNKCNTSFLCDFDWAVHLNDDEEALKGDGKALSGDGEALRMTEGMEGNGEAPHMREIAMLVR